MEAPERIWSEHRTCTVDASGATRLLAMDRQFERGTEYIRADIHRAELEAVREERQTLLRELVLLLGKAE